MNNLFAQSGGASQIGTDTCKGHPRDMASSVCLCLGWSQGRLPGGGEGLVSVGKQGSLREAVGRHGEWHTRAFSLPSPLSESRAPAGSSAEVGWTHQLLHTGGFPTRLRRQLMRGLWAGGVDPTSVTIGVPEPGLRIAPTLTWRARQLWGDCADISEQVVWRAGPSPHDRRGSQWPVSWTPGPGPGLKSPLALRGEAVPRAWRWDIQARGGFCR